MPEQRCPSFRRLFLRRCLHYFCLAMTRSALGTGDRFHRTGTAMFLVTFGTTILDRVRLVETVGSSAEFGVAGLASIINLLNAIGRCAFLKTLLQYLNEPRGR